jgi:fatty acid-binding protein DegV
MEAKTKTIEQFKLHEKDTGSADVQIALLTQRINHLTEQGSQLASWLVDDGRPAPSFAGLSA